MSQPLVLTLRLDSASEKILTALRTRYFPSHRNHLSAHITLFHALPASSQDFYTQTLSSITAREAPFTLGIKSPFPLGKKGVGINIASFKLRKIHDELLEVFEQEVQLTEQDQVRLRAHVTVQNKVSEEEARRTLEALKNEFEEKPGTGEALSLWRYEKNGAWTLLKDFDFQGIR